MTYDRLEYAKIRNRGEQIHLGAILQRLERNKQNDMRISNSEKKRFRSKYSRINSYFSDLKQVSEAKQENIPLHDKSLDYKLLHDMVFTDNGVDIKKILFLHLLSTHRSETITPAKKLKMCNIHSPAERLINKSKKGYIPNKKLTKILPLYTVEIMETGAMGEQLTMPVINDGRFAARLLINHKIRALINVVVEALEQSNNNKFQELVDIAHNPKLIKETILEDKQILEFLDTLYDNPLVTSSDSFILTPPFKVTSNELVVNTKTGHIESLITSIRKHVLSPKKHDLKKIVDEETPVASQSSKSFTSTKMKRSIEDTIKSTGSQQFENSNNNSVTDRKQIRYVSKNFVILNIKNAAKVKKIEYDTDDENDFMEKKASIKSEKPEKSSRVIPKTTVKQPKISVVPDIAENERKQSESKTTSSSLLKQHQELPHYPSNSSNKKFYIKQTTCPACMERWKKPLPVPKTPMVKKTNATSKLENPVLKTDSLNRIGMLINKEMYKLESYDRKYSNDNSSFKYNYKKKDLISDSSEEVNLSPMDLARIEQEIKEKETKKKLEKFLNETIQ